jgi:hypothetical protein
MTLDVFLIYKAKGIVPHFFHQMTGKSRQHIGHLLHQGRGRLECQKISTTLQSDFEMSEATNRRIVSFAHDIIYDVTRVKVENPETCRSGCTV